MAELAATGAVDVVDLKGLYEGEWVDATPSAELYGRVASAFPDAWLEDPRLNERDRPGARAASRPDHLGLPDPLGRGRPGARIRAELPQLEAVAFRLVRRLFDFYDYCAEHGIAIYGGGQFELGPGRGQIQHLASLFHPDGPNDVAPREYNVGGPRPGLPPSPLPPTSRVAGFR